MVNHLVGNPEAWCIAVWHLALAAGRESTKKACAKLAYARKSGQNPAQCPPAFDSIACCKVLVLGCGLSPLVFALADLGTAQVCVNGT